MLRACWPSVLACLLAWAGPGKAQDVRIVHLDRGPFLAPGPTGPVGLLADRLRTILEQAGLAVEFRAVPPARLLHEIETADRPVCAAGWGRTPERERFAWFSRPLYFGTRTVAVVHQSAYATVRADPSLTAALSTPGLIVAALRTFSHGSYIDGLLRTSPNVDWTGSTTADMVRRVAAGRNHVLIAPRETIEEVKREAGRQASALRVVELTDAPAPAPGALMCSLVTPLGMRERLDAAIEAVMPQIEGDRVAEKK